MAQGTCFIEGCGKDAFAKGWCRGHYDRHRRHGDPLHQPIRKVPESYVCEICGDDFQRMRYPQDGDRPFRFCKLRCANAWRARTRNPMDNPDVLAVHGQKIAGAAINVERRKNRRAKKRRQLALRRLERAAKGMRGRGRWYSIKCKGCGHWYVGRYPSEACSQTCRNRLDRWKDRDAYGNYRERARYHGVSYESVNVEAVYQRDGYRCQLCGGKVHGRWPSKTSPSLDHIVPMALGGAHAWENVQLACFGCNITKGTAAFNEQLLLRM